MGEQLSAVQCSSVLHLGVPPHHQWNEVAQAGDPIPWQPLSTPEVLWLLVVASQKRLNFQVQIQVKSLPVCYSPTVPCPPAGSPEQPCLAPRLQSHSRSPHSRMTAPSWKTQYRRSCCCCGWECTPDPNTLEVLEALLWILPPWYSQVL